ncbi:hypothetical protein BC829DRAFT_445862 [Chytridium lagenaria]|nr:hypothetical protein BC829DRAFT_445862 [Chytridium lagenaria]
MHPIIAASDACILTLILLLILPGPRRFLLRLRHHLTESITRIGWIRRVLFVAGVIHPQLKGEHAPLVEDDKSLLVSGVHVDVGQMVGLVMGDAAGEGLGMIGAAVLGWTIVTILILIQSDVHPTAFVLATLSSITHAVSHILESIDKDLPTFLHPPQFISTWPSSPPFFLSWSLLPSGQGAMTRKMPLSELPGGVVPSREEEASVFREVVLYLDDLPDLSASDKAESVVMRFKAFSNSSKIKHLGLRLLAFELPYFIFQTSCSFSANMLAIAAPFLLYRITGFIQDESSTSTDTVLVPLGYAALLGLACMLRALCDGQAWHTGRRVGIRLRSILIDAIYKKGLRRVTVAPSAAAAQALAASGKDPNAAPLLTTVEVEEADEKPKGASSTPDTASTSTTTPTVDTTKPDAAKSETKQDDTASVGKIVTLMSSDCEKIHCWEYLGVGHAFGVAGFCGVGSHVVDGARAWYIAEWANRLLEELMGRTDRRTDVVNEALQGIRIIKFFAWEKNFLRKIKEARSKEMSSLVAFFYQNAVSQLVWDGAPLLVSFGTFFVYTVIAGKELDAKTAFASISLFNSLRIPLLAFPEIMVELFQLNVSVGRIQKFLDSPELEKYEAKRDVVVEEGVDLGFKDGWFSWHVADEPEETSTKKKGKNSTDETTPLLSSSSSSSTLTTLTDSTQSPTAAFTLRNLTLSLPIHGLTIITGSTGSGKSSIIQALLGEMKRVSGEKYLPTGGVAYVAQTSWLMNATIRDNICFGEEFEEGRYGRVVRACALEKDLESFEAGDLTEIGEKGINLSETTCVPRSCVYSRASFILLDDPLSAVDAPTARHLFDQAICGLLRDRTRILVTHAVALTLPRADLVVVLGNGEIVASGPPRDISTVIAGMEGADFNITPIPTASINEPLQEPIKDYGFGKTREDARKLVAAEESQTGAVKLTLFLVVFLAALGIERGAQAMDSFWIKRWVEAYKGGKCTEVFGGGSGVGWRTLSGVLEVTRRRVGYMISLLIGFWERPFRFFDKTPVGRILNRASKDISTIDREVMMSYYFFFALLLDLVAITVIVTSITPFFIVAFLPFIWIYYGIAKDYLASSRELKRLDSVTRSPIYSMFSESLVGASTIRAYGAEQRFQTESLRRVNLNHRAYLYLWCANRWLGVRISTVAGLVIFTAAGITVLSRQTIGPGLAGISLIWSLNFSDYLIWLIRVHAGLEMSLNAVERVGEYLEIEQEAGEAVEGVVVPTQWPTAGAISFNNLELRYAPDLDPVLKDVSFEIPGGSKVGIVGRTGAGKSSLTLALFRIVEPSSGHITIDGLNTSHIPLATLRSNLTIIPQDPFGDDDVWRCLQRVHILETMQTTEGGGEGGETVDVGFGGCGGWGNFSQGQRQLLCLARALLKSSKIAVLDEATASVDHETDARIQQTIRGPDFANVTVLSIATVFAPLQTMTTLSSLIKASCRREWGDGGVGGDDETGVEVAPPPPYV